MRLEPVYDLRAPHEIETVRIGVGVFLENDRGHVLFEKRRDCGMWGLPGGKVDPGESVIGCVHRELREETGLSVCVTRLLGVYSGPDERVVTYPDRVVQLVDVVFVAIPTGGILRVSDESESLLFCDAQHAPHPLVPPARQPLLDYLQGLSSVIR